MMRYRRRPYKRRRRVNKTLATYKRTGATVGATAYKALKLAKYIARQVNVETKQHVANLSGVGVNTTGAIFQLDTIPIGDGYNQRDGVSIKPQTLKWRMIIDRSSSATQTHLRMLILRFKTENDHTVVLSDILSPVGITGFKTWDKRFNSKVLYDKVITYSDTRTTAFEEGFLKLFGHINYDISDTTGGDLESGGLYLLLVSDEATNLPVVTGNFQLTYTDN